MFKLDEFNIKYYEIVSEKKVDEREVEIIELRHIVTKASILLFICDDKNRVFNIAFKTPVMNNKGIPHILEHSVLCGSRKYNVKDPFIELAKTSMNTFLNAMTYPDKTCYPVASANLKDFHNLMDVYLDAVFYPNAVKNNKIFMQEGWHYEIENEGNPLTVNGVVLNEMRGVYSSPDAIIERTNLENTYGGTNYAYDYGGDPIEILDLDFNEFKDFHSKYYSPSNSIISLYGKLDYNSELKYIHDEYLKDFQFVNVGVTFPDAKNIIKDQEMVSNYSIDSDKDIDKSYIAYNFSIDSKKTSLNKIVISILDYVLFSSDSAILKNKFLELGFCESLYSICEFSLKNTLFSVIAQNINIEKKDKFKSLLLSSIQELIDKGIDENKLRAGINSLYFSREEDEYGKIPKGLVLILTSLDTYLYGDDYSSQISYKDSFDYLNSIDLKDKSNVFYKMLENIFINNNHRTISVLLPKLNYVNEKSQALAKLLQEKKNLLTNNQIKSIIAECKSLKEYQENKDKSEDLKCIPGLKVSDLEPTTDYVDYIHEVNENVDTIITYCGGKDIVYLSLKFDITDFTDEEVYLFNIAGYLLSKIDLKSMTYTEFNDYIDINTGGLIVKFDVYEKKLLFSLSLKVMYNKINIAFDVLFKLLTESIFIDNKRILLLMNELKADTLINIISNGHIAASGRALSTLSFQYKFADMIGSTGIAFYKYINSLISNYESNYNLINDTFDLLFKKVKTKKMFLTLSMDKKHHDNIICSFKKFNGKLVNYNIRNVYNEEDKTKLKNNISCIVEFIPFNSFSKSKKKEAIVIPSDVNFVSIANTFDKYKFTGGLYLIKTLFNYEYLWTNIRVLGGAYGCMSLFRNYGVYAFISYRDPNLSKTNDTFYGIYKYLINENICDETIERYIIGSVGLYDNPVSMFNHYKDNETSFFNEISNEKMKKNRDELIHINSDDIKKIADIFSNIDNSTAVAIIGEKSIDEAKKNYDVVWKLVE